MNLVNHLLQKPISEYIQSIFHYNDFVPNHEIERIVPTGHIFLLFELDGFTRRTYHNLTLEPSGIHEEAWISGMQRSYLSISAHQNSSMLVIQFKTHGAYPFINQPLYNLTNTVVPAKNIFGSDILSLRKQLLKQPNTERKFHLVNQWLLSIFRKDHSPPKEILNMLEKLEQSLFRNHNEVISKYPKTQKHLINQFKKFIGLTPKVFHRIIRFNGILQEIHQNQKIVWTDIAYQFGYADQSHLIKEFREFSGFNPQEFIIAKHNMDEPNFFPVA